MATATVPLAGPSCPSCRGGGEVNGVECRDCRGKGRQARPPRARWRAGKMLHSLAGIAAVPTAKTIRGVPGVGGAAAVAVCTGGIVGHFVPGLGPWVAGLIAGYFGLMIDRGL